MAKPKRECGSNRNKRGGNSRKPQSSRSANTEPKELDSTGRDNDPSFYHEDARLAEEVNRLSFHGFMGDLPIAGTDFVVPTIMSILVNPSVMNSYYSASKTLAGEQPSRRSGINLATTKLYTLLSMMSGRTANYAPQDVGTVIGAMSEIISMSEWIRRIFGIKNLTSTRNRAVPKLLIQSMHVDFDDLTANLSLYADRFNTIITQFNRLPILDNIAYIKKGRDMYQKVYSDSDTDMSQLYVMNPYSTWILDEQSFSGGSVLKTVSWCGFEGDQMRPLSQFLSTLETMVDALFNSSTLNLIYADLLNLANKFNIDLFKLDYLYGDYAIVPEYNANFLLQIHNMDIAGAPVNDELITNHTPTGDVIYLTPYNDVYPDPDNNQLVFNPCFNNRYQDLKRRNCTFSLLDMMSNTPTLEDMIESIRWKIFSGSVISDTGGTYFWWIANSLPDHYCVGFQLYSNDPTPFTTLTNNDFDGADWIWDSGFLCRYSTFDWAPFLYMTKADANGFNIVGNIYGETNKWTDFPESTAMAINQIVSEDLFDFRIKGLKGSE